MKPLIPFVALVIACAGLVVSAAPEPGRQRARPRGQDFDELIISAENGHQLSPISLHIDGAGRADLYVGGPAALPGRELTQVGRFASTLSAPELAELRQLLAAARLTRLRHPPGPLPPGDYTSLALVRGGDRREWTLWQQPAPALERLLSRLREIALRLHEQPVSAVHGWIERSPTPRLILEQRGSEELQLQLFDERFAGNYLRVELSCPGTTPPRTAALARAAVVALVEDGRIPAGVITLGVAQRLVIPLAGLTIPSCPQPAGTATFWLTNSAATRAVRLRLEPPPH